MNISAATGDMGILANHVPSIEPLRPGIVEVIESGNASKNGLVRNLQADSQRALTGHIHSSLWWLCQRPPEQLTHHQRH